MKAAVVTIQGLLSVIAVFLGLIWHKMPGKENLPVLEGEMKQAYKTKGLSEKLSERRLDLGELSVSGDVGITDAVEVKHSGPLEVKVTNPSSDALPVKIERN